MDVSDTYDGLKQHLPVEPADVTLGARAGLVVVDVVKGFAEVGCGPLAPAEKNEQVDQMICESDILARTFVSKGYPVLAFLDTHTPGVPEPPYPPHCERGSGQELLVDVLSWFNAESSITQVRKDCINGFIGSIAPDGSNAFVDWAQKHAIEQIVVVGICTDICVMDFVLTLLSIRNHGILSNLRDVIVYEPGCATYHLPASVAETLSLPRTAIHPQALAHHIGLYSMASRGAVIANRLSF
ncbi:MAG: isochorismatase family protein [Verrucomicrobiota bacterium]